MSKWLYRRAKHLLRTIYCVSLGHLFLKRGCQSSNKRWPFLSFCWHSNERHSHIQISRVRADIAGTFFEYIDGTRPISPNNWSLHISHTLTPFTLSAEHPLRASFFQRDVSKKSHQSLFPSCIMVCLIPAQFLKFLNKCSLIL